MRETVTLTAGLEISKEGTPPLVILSGPLNFRTTPPIWATIDDLLARVPKAAHVLDVTLVSECDTAGAALIFFLRHHIEAVCGCTAEIKGANEQVQSLLKLVDRPKPVEPEEMAPPKGLGAIEQIGEFALAAYRQFHATFVYVGRIVQGLWLSLRRPRSIRWPDTIQYMSRSGADALGIVALINFLMGMILAFQMGTQARQYGAELFVADVVGLAIIMELGPLMTAVIVAGRSGSAFAAEIGTMKVNEELDAIDTMGLEQTRFLIMPKVIALLLVMPLLCVYANFCGIVGGLFVGNTYLGQPVPMYVERTKAAIDFWEVSQGLIKGQAYAVMISAVSCLRGLQTAKGAQGVGLSTTSAVVSSIFLVICTDLVLTVIFQNV
jgi:phospholipid/cholesterol/gamma-HCH transport system permease protein